MTRPNLPADQFYEGNAEPPLSHMLSDPVFLAVLRRDGLTVEDLCAQLGLPFAFANGNEPSEVAQAA